MDRGFLPHGLVPRDWTVQLRSWSMLCIHSLFLMGLLRSQGMYSYMAVYPSLPPIVAGGTFSYCYEAGDGGSGKGGCRCLVTWGTVSGGGAQYVPLGASAKRAGLFSWFLRHSPLPLATIFNNSWDLNKSYAMLFDSNYSLIT